MSSIQFVWAYNVLFFVVVACVSALCVCVCVCVYLLCVCVYVCVCVVNFHNDS